MNKAVSSAGLVAALVIGGFFFLGSDDPQAGVGLESNALESETLMEVTEQMVDDTEDVYDDSRDRITQLKDEREAKIAELDKIMKFHHFNDVFQERVRQTRVVVNKDEFEEKVSTMFRQLDVSKEDKKKMENLVRVIHKLTRDIVIANRFLRMHPGK